MDYVVRWLPYTELEDATKEVDILKEEVRLLNDLSSEHAWVLIWESVLEILSSTQGLHLPKRFIIYLAWGICAILNKRSDVFYTQEGILDKKTISLMIGARRYVVKFLTKEKFEKAVKKAYVEGGTTPHVGGKNLYLGLTDNISCVILINTTDQSQRVILITAWHEFIHAILDQFEANTLSENKVDALAYMLVNVMTDNEGLRSANTRTSKKR